MPRVPLAAPPPPPAVTITDARVSPARPLFGTATPVSARFTVTLDTPRALHVEFVAQRTGRIARRKVLRPIAPGTLRATWDAVRADGTVAPDGRYRVRVVVPSTGQRRLLGTFTLHGHVYPIDGPHADRGPVGQFGVPRNGGRTHEGYDVNAACGTPLVAVRAGTVVRRRYDPVLYGNEVIVRGAREGRTYRYAHLREPARVRLGQHVRTGALLGHVGATGNARTIGCHLHLELRAASGRLLDPRPWLHAWDTWS